MKKMIRIGTRGSALALWQASFIKNKIATNFPDGKIELKIIKTRGDSDQTSSLTRVGGQGFFTKAIEEALIEGTIDLAVHSLKDMPTKMPDAVHLGAIPERGQAGDVLISHKYSDFVSLPQGAIIATGSLRRRALIKHLRADIKLRDLRGNIQTRLIKLRAEDYDGIIMAEAVFLERLDIKDAPFYRFSFDEMLPAVGQGAIGVQARREEKYLDPILAAINHHPTWCCVSAERALLHRLDSGCQFPVAAFAQIHGNQLNLRGLVASIDGKRVIKAELSGPFANASAIGIGLAEQLLSEGANELLHGV